MVKRIETPPPGLPPRRLEETDTKQAILRQDPDFGRKKRDKAEKETSDDPYEDLSDVSVPALRSFLQNLLAKIDKNTGAQAQTSSSELQPQPAREAASPKAAAAMQAYQTRAQTNHVPISLPEEAASNLSALDAATLNLERPLLLEIIRDLDRIHSAGITAISLEKADGFLASIQAGIAKALDNL